MQAFNNSDALHPSNRVNLQAIEEPGQSFMTELRENWLSHLINFREQGMRISDINPVAALADIICEQLYVARSTEVILMPLWSRSAKIYGPVNASICAYKPALPTRQRHCRTWAITTLPSRSTARSLPRIRYLPCAMMCQWPCAAML